MLKKILALLMLTVLCASCSAQGPSAAPELLQPAIVQADIALVTRGDVERIQQYRGIVRVKSEGLTYGVTDLVFDQYHCNYGEQVAEGQLLATLNTENLEEQIEAKRENISRLETEYGFENEGAELDIAILQTELADLTLAAAAYDKEAMMAAEQKRLEIERRRLAMTHAQERQALTLQNEQEDLARLLEQVSNSELRAPYAGVITYLTNKEPNSPIGAYENLVFISDDSEIFVEYSAMVSLPMPINPQITGTVGSNEYQLERIILSQQERAFYSLQQLSAPVRFKVLNPDENLTVGSYISIYIHSNVSKDVLRIPFNALYTDSDIGSYVYVMENGQKTMRTVEVGARADAYVEIVSGLVEGDEVFVQQ